MPNPRQERRVLAGQVIVAGFAGHEPPASLADAAGRGELAGWILFRRNVQSVAQLAELNRALLGLHPAQWPALIGVDQEGGRVARVGPPLLQLPAMGTLGRIDRVELTERAAALLGRQLAALGFNLNFAPVLDVDSNPRNPVIGDRAFGRDPARVVRHAAAFARGLQRAGIAACGKHFPGHGDTVEDSHLSLPRLTHPLADLERRELVPFRQLAPELAAIMTAHVVFDAIDPERPATLSAAVVQGLLRTDLGYGGLVFSDDLEMKAICAQRPIGEAARDAIAAGCDAVLICSGADHVDQARETLERAAESDPAFAARLAEAVARGLKLRQRFVARPRTGDLPDLDAARDLEAEIGALAGALSAQPG